MERQLELAHIEDEKQQAKTRRLLSQVFEEELGEAAPAYWNHWVEYNSRAVLNRKPTRYGYDYAYSDVPSTVRIPGFVTVAVGSCLPQGTLIQTAAGLRPIESIRIGDQVVSQNVTTGELTVKPVLLTTVRPPTETLLVTTASDRIESTLGHYWWIAGHGWVRTRDLKPGMRFHTATGTAEIESVKSMPEKVTTYNLVVDSFHTYFVGKERILSYDVTELRPTFQTVPGLPADSR